jgi:integrase
MASIDRRPNGKYRARWREFAQGPQKTKQFDRKVDAERFLVDVQHRLLSGTYVAPEHARTTLSAYAEVYLARQPWRPATLAAATNALAHAEPLNARPVGSIRKGDVQALVSGLDLAPGTVGLVFQHLNALLEAAADDGVISRNPARGVNLPATAGGEVVPPTTAQAAALYDAAAEWFRPAIVLGAGLGLRQAETTGLTVDRVLWLERAVRVDRQWITSRGRAEFGPPKTKSSNRTIPASQWVLDELGAHVGRRHDGSVLQQDDGPVRSRVFQYQWARTTRRAGLVGVKYHHLRHAFASMLISAGCSVKAVQHALGHASAATTLDLYGHLWPGDEDRIRQAVDKALAGPAEDSLRTDTARK